MIIRLYILLILSGFYYQATAQYRLVIAPVDKDSAFIGRLTGLQYTFPNRGECDNYIVRLPDLLMTKGFPAASVDSVAYGNDTAIATVFFGAAYKIGYINTNGIEKQLLERAGWNERDYVNKSFNITQLQTLQSHLLDYLENNGYPFAKVQLDSVQLEGDQFSATLKITKGPLYKIDSIRVFGDSNISAAFLQRYLDIPAGSIYQKSKLQNIHKKLLELPYVQEVQPWDLTMLGTGSLLNVYLKPKKSSQVNVLLGLLSSDNQSQPNKLRLTGEATINLRNVFGNGEQFGLNWQQLQVKSPRLDLSFTQPYLFSTPFGVTGSFNLLKKDSSYINLGFLLGVQYALSAAQTGKVFIQNFSTNLLTVDTNAIKNTKALPAERDVSLTSLGVDYNLYKTDYRFNPRKGVELNLIAAAGIRKVRKNNLIEKLQSPDHFNYAGLYDSVPLSSYQFRIRLSSAYYLWLGGQSTLKIGVNGGWLQSQQLYRNELFQIGGYKLLRGFDEESIYASHYAVGTLEYRYLIGVNSYLFSFADIGFTADKSINKNLTNNFIGVGLGMAFETKAGIFNLSYAIGKEANAPFNLRLARIHIGYINYF